MEDQENSFTTQTGRRFHIIAGREVTGEEIVRAAYLDRETYEEQYFLTVETCVAYLQHNPYIYTMAVDEKTGQIVAYLNFTPVTDQMYDILRSGTVRDTVITPEDVEDYTPDSTLSAYLSSIVVDPAFRGQGIARHLFCHFFSFLASYTNQNRISLRRIVADAVTKEGERLAERLGFLWIRDSNHDSKIMELDLTREEIPVNGWNEDLLKVYGRDHG